MPVGGLGRTENDRVLDDKVEEKQSLDKILAEPVSSSIELRDRLEAAIVSGLLPIGHKLVNERQLAQMVGMARATVRSALEKLERDGLVKRSVGSGTYVADFRNSGSSAGKKKLPTPGEFLEFRLILEPALADHVVLRASDEALEEIRAFVLESRNVTTWQETEFADSEFHRRLCFASNNEMLQEAGRMMTAARKQFSWLHLKEQRFDWDTWWEYQREHEEIIEALLARDGRRASDLLGSHVDVIRKRRMSR